MFRNPRENASPTHDTPILPSIGRPPTPPNAIHLRNSSLPAMSTRSSSTHPLGPRPGSKSNLLTPGRQAAKKIVNTKASGKPNGSILTFFKKVDSSGKDDALDTLFMSQASPKINGRRLYSPSPTPDLSDADAEENIYEDDSLGIGRYNETAGSIKRRRLSCDSGHGVDKSFNGDKEATGSLSISRAVKTEEDSSSIDGLEPQIVLDGETCTPPPRDDAITKKRKSQQRGPFLDDSESEAEDSRMQNRVKNIAEDGKTHTTSDGGETIELERSLEQSMEPNQIAAIVPFNRDRITGNVLHVTATDKVRPVSHDTPSSGDAVTAASVNDPHIQSLTREDTSFDGYGLEDIEDFLDDEEFAGGEEFVERRWMEEQARLEALENGDEDPSGDDLVNVSIDKDNNTAIRMSCPICDVSLDSITSDQASRHVNACLDGNPMPLPILVKTENTEIKMIPPGAVNRFSRAAIARPGQANPFEIGNVGTTPSSAFSKLMASHAEDAAWANAAAAEQSARGKPAYQRTCPFYKIMPGFFICVDAFRYGAVQGCNAYFLSHFHSDHYVGLTSSWCHGPIYCSKVTANLVRQQLRVDAKWVIPLEFENRFEVPGTQGVAVTMIPANHCPGSSLFLYEKVVGKGTNPKVQRVLHCGDFRACPAHVAHPLLMPDVVDSITGNTKQQKIDVCYLDTTYLNPRYAFPSQDDVTKACADMCVSLKKDRAEESDAWEVVKKERAGAGMAKFVGTSVKLEDDSIAMEVGSNKTRGRLLVICGTYSIGKERICMGIARALDCKIWAPPGKQRICAALEDPELMSRLTEDPREAQIHMQMLMEIRAETLQDYLNGYKPHFSRVVGFRPSGWNYRPPNSRFVESPAIQTVLTSDNWKSRYTMTELVPQRGSTREASCFGVPYSEHSSFRELTMFCCALRIEKIIPTVNVGSAASRAKMKTWIDRWLAERRKNGLVKIGERPGEVRW